MIKYLYDFNLRQWPVTNLKVTSDNFPSFVCTASYFDKKYVQHCVFDFYNIPLQYCILFLIFNFYSFTIFVFLGGSSNPSIASHNLQHLSGGVGDLQAVPFVDETDGINNVAQCEGRDICQNIKN